MQVNEALLHGWFFGNYWVRVAGAVLTGALLGAIPFATIAAWLFADADKPAKAGDALILAVRLMRPATRVAVIAGEALGGFIPTVIAMHGGGHAIGLSTAVAAVAGHRFSPWSRHRTSLVPVTAGALIGALVGAL